MCGAKVGVLQPCCCDHVPMERSPALEACGRAPAPHAPRWEGIAPPRPPLTFCLSALQPCCTDDTAMERSPALEACGRAPAPHAPRWEGFAPPRPPLTFCLPLLAALPLPS